MPLNAIKAFQEPDSIVGVLIASIVFRLGIDCKNLHHIVTNSLRGEDKNPHGKKGQKIEMEKFFLPYSCSIHAALIVILVIESAVSIFAF